MRISDWSSDVCSSDLYASLGDLPERDPAFHDLKRLLDKQVKTFAKACHFDLAKPLKLDSMWVNILKPGGTHSGHIHPHSIVSGTFYVAVPPGSGARTEEHTSELQTLMRLSYAGVCL